MPNNSDIVINQKLVSTWTKEILDAMPVLKDKIAAIPTETPINPREAIEEVMKFLFLISKSNTPLTPSLPVDLVWHEFVLCTRVYAKFCEDKFYRFIHHTPGGEEKENKRQYLKTIQLYIKYFGEPNAIFWGSYANNEWLDSQCGSCNTN